jgi:hypothetical protein
LRRYRFVIIGFLLVLVFLAHDALMAAGAHAALAEHEHEAPRLPMVVVAAAESVVEVPVSFHVAGCATVRSVALARNGDDGESRASSAAPLTLTGEALGRLLPARAVTAPGSPPDVLRAILQVWRI